MKFEVVISVITLIVDIIAIIVTVWSTKNSFTAQPSSQFSVKNTAINSVSFTIVSPVDMYPQISSDKSLRDVIPFILLAIGGFIQPYFPFVLLVLTVSTACYIIYCNFLKKSAYFPVLKHSSYILWLASPIIIPILYWGGIAIISYTFDISIFSDFIKGLFSMFLHAMNLLAIIYLIFQQLVSALATTSLSNCVIMFCGKYIRYWWLPIFISALADIILMLPLVA